jgi:hypothetical protein
MPDKAKTELAKALESKASFEGRAQAQEALGKL